MIIFIKLDLRHSSNINHKYKYFNIALNITSYEKFTETELISVSIKFYTFTC